MPTIISALPYTLTNGTTADASQVQANFAQIVANTNANGAANGANSDITSLTGLTTPLGRTYGGSQFYVGGTSTGAANAQVVASLTPAGFSLYAGVMVAFISGFNNSGATTFEIGGAAVKNAYRQISTGAAACVGGEIKSGQLVVAVYDGTQWQIVNQGYLSTALLRSFGGLSVTTGDLIYGSAADTVSRLAAGTNGHILTLAGGLPSWAANTAAIAATQAEMEAGSITTAWASPGRTQYHPGVAKAWVQFVPRGTNGVCTINRSHNVASVDRTASGTYLVTFTTAFSDANYTAFCSHQFSTLTVATVNQGAPSTGSCTIYSVDVGGGAYNGSVAINAAFYGDQ